MSIKSCRERASYSQLSLATVLKIDPSTVSKWENGVAKPQADKLIAMSKLFGCSIDDLLEVEKNEMGNS